MQLRIIFFCFFFAIVLLNANEPDKVTLQLQWKHQFEFAGFYAAKEKGFYAEEGLDVSFVEYENGMSIADEVLDGKAHYGVAYPTIIAEYLNGKPLLLLANFFKQSPHVLITQPEIKTPAMLKGKTIAGMPNNIDYMMFYIMLEKFDIGPEDIRVVPSSFGYRDFMEKRVDADTVFKTNELYELDRRGIEYNVFDPTLYGPVYYDLNLFTTQREYRLHPDRVRRFRRASIRGWEYAMSHQEEIVELILKQYNTMGKSKAALRYEAKEMEQIILSKVHPVGSVDIDRVRLIADTFKQAGYIKKNPQPIEHFYLDDESGKVVLNAGQRAFLAEKERLRVCIRPERMPLEGFEAQRHTGIAADYLSFMQDQLGIAFDAVLVDHKDRYDAYAPDVPCDIWSLEAITPSREALLEFTAPVLEVPIALVTRKQTSSTIDLHVTGLQKIAVPPGSAILEFLERNYPNLVPVVLPNMDEAVKQLQTGLVDGLAETLPLVDEAFTRDKMQGLKINAIFDEKLKMGFATRKEEPVLHTILQQTLEQMSRNEKKEILDRWFAFSKEPSLDYALLLKILAAVSFVGAFILYRQYELRKHNRHLQEEIRNELEKASERNRMLFQQKKLASMGEMIGNIAHQWRQPLSQVNSAVMVIDDRIDEKRCSDEEIEQKLKEIEDLTRYMSETIDTFGEFLNNTKPVEKVRLADAVRKSLGIIVPVMKRHNIALRTDMDESLEYPLILDEFQQVILTLLYNAYDVFVERKVEKPVIDILLKRDGAACIIQVCDNGGGIDPDVIDRIFEPYFTTKEKTQGRGLGLYLSQMISKEKMGEGLYAENRDKGACFTIILGACRG